MSLNRTICPYLLLLPFPTKKYYQLILKRSITTRQTQTPSIVGNGRCRRYGQIVRLSDIQSSFRFKVIYLLVKLKDFEIRKRDQYLSPRPHHLLLVPIITSITLSRSSLLDAFAANDEFEYLLKMDFAFSLLEALCEELLSGLCM